MSRLALFASLALALAATSATSAPPAAPAWVITPDGLGPLKIGMTPKQAQAALGRKVTTDNSFDASCRPYEVEGLESLSLLFMDGKLDSIDFSEGATWKTAGGVKVGDTDAAIRKAYGAAAHKTRSAYEDPPAAYYTVRGPGPHGIKFTTDSSRKITNIDAGGDSIGFIEGCA
ncbi:hypothetical protein ACO2Q3_14305 [Caulobacter sp. KR2-114]|uniref:hypothetical protein n=1 Tax=Caulobacter sp. KR2-114 TaxID=3400912 RepID=UPI003C08CAD3